MDEFVSRMATQRHVIDVVNKNVATTEKLFGLSASAIERWALVNGFKSTSHTVKLLKKVSSTLFFMAARSQEPVSSEYTLRRNQIIAAVSELETAVK